MGRLEKFVVLTVLFLVAVILGISLNSKDVPAGAGSDLLAAESPQAVPPGGTASGRGPGIPDAREDRSGSSGLEDAPGGPDGLLSALVAQPADDTAPEPVNPSILPGSPGEVPSAPRAPAADATAAEPRVQVQADTVPEPPKPYVLTTEGLVASRVDDLMIYTWIAGDSFTSLSDRYYGSRLETGRLRAANEGRDETALRPGDKIFVPVRAAGPAASLARSSEQAGTWIGGVYVVQSGDMLGSIAKTVYGSAARWRKIYDANRDVLSSPDDLKIGMRLRIPE